MGGRGVLIYRGRKAGGDRAHVCVCGGEGWMVVQGGWGSAGGGGGWEGLRAL